MVLPPIPDEKTIDRAAKLGRMLMDYLGILLIGVVIAAFFGWIDSPMLSEVRENQRLLQAHETRETEVARAHVEQIRIQTAENKRIAAALERVVRLLKILDCGSIADKTLRDRCMAQ